MCAFSFCLGSSWHRQLTTREAAIHTLEAGVRRPHSSSKPSFHILRTHTVSLWELGEHEAFKVGFRGIQKTNDLPKTRPWSVEGVGLNPDFPSSELRDAQGLSLTLVAHTRMLEIAKRMEGAEPIPNHTWGLFSATFPGNKPGVGIGNM